MYFSQDIEISEGAEKISFELCDKKFEKADTGIIIYDKYKMTVMLSDGLVVVTERRIYNTFRGDILLFRPNEVHFARILRAANVRYITFLIPKTFFSHFSEGNESILDPFRDGSDERVNLLSPSEAERSFILQISESIAKEGGDTVNDGRYNENAPSLYVFSALVCLLRTAKGMYRVQRSNPVYTDMPAVVRRSMNLISEGFTDGGLTLSSLAKTLRCSVTYLTKTFKKHTGKTVHAYITEKRLAMARKLLQGGGSVSEVCFLCGFGDSSNFSKCFASHYGVTPKKVTLEAMKEKTADNGEN